MKTREQVDQNIAQLSLIGKAIYYLQCFFTNRCSDPFCPGRTKPWSTRKAYCEICDTPEY